MAQGNRYVSANYLPLRVRGHERGAILHRNDGAERPNVVSLSGGQSHYWLLGVVVGDGCGFGKLGCSSSQNAGAGASLGCVLRCAYVARFHTV
jgi:hypothetical protein